MTLKKASTLEEFMDDINNVFEKLDPDYVKISISTQQQYNMIRYDETTLEPSFFWNLIEKEILDSFSYEGDMDNYNPEKRQSIDKTIIEKLKEKDEDIKAGIKISKGNRILYAANNLERIKDIEMYDIINNGIDFVDAINISKDLIRKIDIGSIAQKRNKRYKETSLKNIDYILKKHRFLETKEEKEGILYWLDEMISNDKFKENEDRKKVSRLNKNYIKKISRIKAEKYTPQTGQMDIFEESPYSKDFIEEIEKYYEIKNNDNNIESALKKFETMIKDTNNNNENEKGVLLYEIGELIEKINDKDPFYIPLAWAIGNINNLFIENIKGIKPTLYDHENTSA